MTRRLGQFAFDFRAVAQKLSLTELAIICDVISAELVERAIPGVGRMAEVASHLRDRQAALDARRPIHSADCSELGGPI